MLIDWFPNPKKKQTGFMQKNMIIIVGMVKHLEQDMYRSHYKIKYSNSGIITKFKLFSKNSVKLIKELLLDNTNYSNELVDDVCKNNYFPYAIIVTRNHEIEGIINIGCQERVWSLEPKSKNGELLILNEKGLQLKEKIFNLK